MKSNRTIRLPPGRLLMLIIVLIAGLSFFGRSVTVQAVRSNNAPVGGDLPAVGELLEYLPLIFSDFNVPVVFGVEMTTINPGQVLTMVEELGSYWMRNNGLLWSAVEPVDNGGYQWGNVAALEAELIATSEAGMRTILVVRSTPSWAQLKPGVFCGPMKQAFFDDFGAFLVAAVNRYSAPPFNVKHFEIWNEPDVDPTKVPPDQIFGCWGDKNDPLYGGGYYGSMLKVVYPMMKGANPTIKVLVGGLLLDCDPRNPPAGKSCAPSRFLEGILTAGAKNSFDGVSFHAYDFYNAALDTFGNPNWHSGKYENESNGSMRPVVIKKVEFLNEVLAAFNTTGKFLMNTESALLCGGNFDPPGQPPCDAEDTSPFEIMKAAYIAQAFPAAIDKRLDANLWFTVTGWRNSGLVYTDKTPRPAYHAFDFSETMLRTADYKGLVQGYPGITGYRFERTNGNDLWLVWAWGGGPQVMNLPAVPLAIWDATGDPVAVNGTTVTLTVEPFYVEMP